MKQDKTKEEKREEFSTRIGPLLKALFDKQKKVIKETTWDCITPSDYEVGEIIAKKMVERNPL